MKKANPTVLSMRIRTLRKEADLLQSDLAKKLNTTASNISNYESGKTVPPIDKIREMSTIFNVPIDYLTGESDSRVFKVEKQYIEVDHYVGELIRAIDNPENALKYNGVPIAQSAKEILKMNLEHALNVLRVQQTEFFNDIFRR